MGDMAEKEAVVVLARHQRVALGMTRGSADICRCGERIMPTIGDDEISLRRDHAMARHQAAMLAELLIRPTQTGSDQ